MIEPSNKVSLKVGGYAYEAWKSVKISHGIEQLAGTFSLTVANIADAWAIADGDSCEVSIGTGVVITGYIDTVSIKADAKSSAINVQGRDKAGDLVDSSAPAKEWGGQSFEAISLELLKPYGISLKTQLETSAGGYKAKKAGKDKAPEAKAFNGGGALPKKSTNTGETVHKLLEKMCKQQGCLLVSDRVGGLVITRAGLNGFADDVLQYGGNMLSVQFDRSAANLFSEITVKGQVSGDSGQYRLNTVTESRVKPVATVTRKDTTIKGSIARYRPLIIAAEEQADAARCKRRAEWEVGTREAKSRKIVIKVQGWRQSTGKLWEINTLVNIISPYTKRDDQWVISNINYDLNESGTIAELTLYSPLAYDVLPEIPVKSGNGNSTYRANLATVKR
jgi:prophage tail gpP-like protein